MPRPLIQKNLITKQLSKLSGSRILCLTAIFLSGIHLAGGAEFKTLPSHVSHIVSQLTPKGRLAATNELWLSIGLPLPDRPGLEKFVADVSDPSSPYFHHYLTPAEFAARFGPSDADYEAVKNFARTNHLVIKTTYANRLLLDVAAPAATVEKAFHVKMQTYRHPTEARDFFAPDVEPTVNARLPVALVEGMDNFSRPHPRRSLTPSPAAAPRVGPGGSSPDGNGMIFGDDFRHAYVPGTTLTGAGQSVGLLEFDGSFSNSIAAYATITGGGRTNIAIQYVLVQGFNGVPTAFGGEEEVDMDIEVIMAIAPGLSSIVVFEGSPSNFSPLSVLNTMVASNSVKSLSCSWDWFPTTVPYTNLDTVFLEMAAQGQSFFDASGDVGAFTTGVNSTNGVDNPALFNVPSSDPYITQVGGTFLGMDGNGASWSSERTWNDGVNSKGTHFNNSASSGGVSSFYTIPTWQTNFASAAVAAGGSATFRNIPDVACCARGIYEILGKNAVADTNGGGTSSAAPLWAGFIALVNQQLAAQGEPSVGFVNPLLYSIASGPNYLACFHDVTIGSNTWNASPNLFVASAGYDLCTGLGTMNGTNLINALSALVAPAFLNPVFSGRQITLAWPTLSGKSYQLQYTTNLIKPNWINLGSATNAAGSGITATDSPTNSQRYYRIMKLP